MKKSLTKIKEKIFGFKNIFWSLSLKKKILIFAILIGAIGGGVWYWNSQSESTEVTYQTETVEKGTLIETVSASGTITSSNSTSVTTKASGVVTEVYVTNGEYVTKGQAIAEVELDEYATQRQAEAWNSYLDSKEAVITAQKEKAQADIDMWQARQDILDAEDEIEDILNGAINPVTNESYTLSERTIIDKTLTKSQLAFDEAELKYKDADAEISAAQTKVTSTWKDYQQNSSTIYAPSDGEISDVALATGIVLNEDSSTSTSGTTIVSAQTVGKISTDSQLIATVSLTEIDVISVKANQKVTMTLDAYEDQTLTGKVLAVNTAGSSNSGVTSYPVSILIDDPTVDIYPNMAVAAEIITNIETDVLLVPTTAVTTQDDVSTVQIMKDEQLQVVQVEIGTSTDSQTVIISGLSEGDEIVTGTSSGAYEFSSTYSPFGGNSSRSSSDDDSSSSKSNSGFSSMGVMGGGGPPGGF